MEDRLAGRAVGPARFLGLAGLFFLSGTGGLILQVLWMYRLGLVFGNAAYATAATLAAFFLGLAAGGWFLGRAAERMRRPLAAYGLLELGIAISALLWTPGLGLYESHYASVLALLGGNRAGLIGAKLLFSTVLLLTPTFLMGGTFPVLTHYLVGDRRLLGTRGSLLYGLNTLGAAAGAFLAGFHMLPTLGVRTSYLTAVALLAAVGIVALVLDRVSGSTGGVVDSASIEAVPGASSAPLKDGGGSGHPGVGVIVLLAVASGFLTLSAETLWTRMFAQVLQNSVYSFSAILVVFLLALGVGGLLAHVLARSTFSTAGSLGVLLAASALMVGLSPVVFEWMTGGLSYIAPRASWSGYLVAVFRTVGVVVVPPTILMGAVFPFLLRAWRRGGHAGPIVGRLVLLNSLGAVAGPIVVGFFLLDAVGLWFSLKIVGVAYGALAITVLAWQGERRSLRRFAIPVLATVVVLAVPVPSVVRLEPGEELRAVWQGSDGIVSVVEVDGSLQMRLDNFYALGDSRSFLVEQMQAHVPLMMHPAPSDVLFLGMGTGLTVGGALSHDVERVVAAELIPNVVRAARTYFEPWTNGLFQDSRVEIVADDARNFLLGSPERFDVIVGDLFTPWHAGTGSLYTVEQFRLVREHLADGGIFAQWLPFYQLTPADFETIAATFASVFPQVTVWRADFSDSRTSIALIGQEAGARLDQEVLRRNSRNVTQGGGEAGDSEVDHMAALFYVGNLTAASPGMARVALNTDDRRAIEMNAPARAQEVGAGQATFVVGAELERLFTSLRTAVPSDRDPYLASLPEQEARYADAGLLYFRYLRLTAAGRASEAEAVLRDIRTLAPRFGEAVGRSEGGGA